MSPSLSRVAQLVEQLTVNQRVAGSSPAAGVEAPPESGSCRVSGGVFRLGATCGTGNPGDRNRQVAMGWRKGGSGR